MSATNTDYTTKPVILSLEAIERQSDETFPNPGCGQGLTWKTLVSSSKTATNTLTSGIATCALGNSYLCVHQHQQAEIYHIIDGEGVVEIDGVEHGVKNGSVVFIPGDAEHGVRNLSDDRELVWLYVFAADDFSEVEYRFRDDQPVPDGSGLRAVGSKI